MVPLSTSAPGAGTSAAVTTARACLAAPSSLARVFSGIVPRGILLKFELEEARLHGWGLWRVLRQRSRQ